MCDPEPRPDDRGGLASEVPRHHFVLVSRESTGPRHGRIILVLSLLLADAAVTVTA